MGRAHETVRAKVSEVVRESLSKAIDSMLKQVKGSLAEWKLTQLKSLLGSLEVYDVIIKHELPAGGGYVDVDVLGSVIFELKSKTSEFKEGEEKISNKYLPHRKKARWAVITNYDVWNFYRVEDERLKLTEQLVGSEATKKLFSIFLEELSEDLKLAPSQSTIAVLFKDVSSYENQLLDILKRWEDDESVKPLFEAYKTIIFTLYGEADESFYRLLYVKHTLLQMIVSSCLSSALLKYCSPIEACSGLRLPVEIALPYLNWWHIILFKASNEEKEFLEKLTEDIYAKSQLLDWEIGSVEDAFRELYELLIDPETRRKIGEYYTPLWLVDLLVKRVREYNESFSGKLIVDPFCGSGTFLVRAFHMKVREGQRPEDAIKEVIGFDINPLATSIARAELMLAYRVYRNEPATPLVFHADTLAVMFELGNSEFYSIYEVKKIRDLANSVVNEIVFSNNRIRPEDLVDLLKIEMVLREVLESYYQGVGNYDRVVSEGELKYTWGVLGNTFLKSLKENSKEWKTSIESLVKKYGNGVWSVAISSIIAPIIVSKIGADVVLTNPPWSQLTKISDTYKEAISKISRKLLRKIGIPDNKVGNVFQGSDLASIALWGGVRWSRSAVGYVMPRESSFCAKFRQRAGLVTTYAVIKDFEGELIDVDYDAFQHGNYPALVILKKRGIEDDKVV